MEVPHGFVCPISHEIMDDPVMDPEGNTYERQRIEEWLGRESRSPLTNSELSKSQLVPNRALKDSIQEFLKNQQHVEGNYREPMAMATTSKNRKAQEFGKVGDSGGGCGSFPSRSGDSAPWVMLDVRGDRGAEVSDYTQLAVGTQISFDCVYPVSAGAVEAKFRHHGVYIGMLTPELWEQMEGCDPCLLNRHCVIHLQRDEQRLTSGRVEIHAVEDFCNGRPLFAHRCDDRGDEWAVLARAFEKLNQTVPFNHKTSNCEHFATWCTKGERSSKQGEKAQELETATWSTIAVGAFAFLAAGAMILSGAAGSDSEKRRDRRR